MMGIQSLSVLELDLAKSIRASDIEAAERSRVRRLARRRARSADPKNTGVGVGTSRPARATPGRLGAPRQSSG